MNIYLTLSNQLAGIELSDNGLKHLRCNGGQHTLIVILAKNGVYLWQLFGYRTIQDTQCDVDILQILATGYHRHIAGLRPNVKDDGTLHPGNEEVCALADNGLLDAREAIEDYSSVSTFNII